MIATGYELPASSSSDLSADSSLLVEGEPSDLFVGGDSEV
jgi:hypothetical protein